MRGRILIIDDSQPVRALLRAQLHGRDLVVMEAENADEGLRMARETHPDVILLDIEMPDRDGFAVLEELRADEELREVPVIFLTGRIDPDDVARGLRGGAHDYLRKPADAIELVARLNAALRTRRLQDELRKRNEELEQAACTDLLTGLYNRRFADEELVKLCARSRRYERDLAVALLDLDGFKAVNDTHGHEVGDAALVEVGHRLAVRKRPEDVLGRWGGEEFIVLMPDCALEGAIQATQGFRAAIGERPIAVRGQEVHVTLSAGVSAFVPDDRPEDIVRRADEALNEAKNAGRDRVKPEL